MEESWNIEKEETVERSTGSITTKRGKRRKKETERADETSSENATLLSLMSLFSFTLSFALSSPPIPNALTRSYSLLSWVSLVCCTPPPSSARFPRSNESKVSSQCQQEASDRRRNSRHDVAEQSGRSPVNQPVTRVSSSMLCWRPWRLYFHDEINSASSFSASKNQNYPIVL